jgi:hypothetical protein
MKASASTNEGNGEGNNGQHPKVSRLTLTPQHFRGGSDEFVESHLDQFIRVAECNGWGDQLKVLYFPHFLGGTARTWYYTWETDRVGPVTWIDLKAAFRSAFKSIGGGRFAEQRLRERTQRINESPEDFVYSIVDLCNATDPNMLEGKKVSILLEKMSPEYMKVVNQTHPETIDDVLKEMRTLAESEIMAKHLKYKEILTIERRQEVSVQQPLKGIAYGDEPQDNNNGHFDSYGMSYGSHRSGHYIHNKEEDDDYESTLIAKMEILVNLIEEELDEGHEEDHNNGYYDDENDQEDHNNGYYDDENDQEDYNNEEENDQEVIRGDGNADRYGFDIDPKINYEAFMVHNCTTEDASDIPYGWNRKEAASKQDNDGYLDHEEDLDGHQNYYGEMERSAHERDYYEESDHEEGKDYYEEGHGSEVTGYNRKDYRFNYNLTSGFDGSDYYQENNEGHGSIDNGEDFRNLTEMDERSQGIQGLRDKEGFDILHYNSGYAGQFSDL